MNVKGLRIHFIGIGGIGMSSIAQIALERGAVITGSDLRRNKNIDRLIERGAKFELGHNSDHVMDHDLVVYSAAISPDCRELLKAKELEIPTISRAVMLGRLMDKKKRGTSGNGKNKNPAGRQQGYRHPHGFKRAFPVAAHRRPISSLGARSFEQGKIFPEIIQGVQRGSAFRISFYGLEKAKHSANERPVYKDCCIFQRQKYYHRHGSSGRLQKAQVYLENIRKFS